MFKFLHKQYSFRTDYLITAINGIAVLLGVFFLNGLIARKAGLEVLGEFTFVKRIITSIVGVLLIGTNVSLPYYLGREKEKSYVISAIILFVLLSLPVMIIIGLLIRKSLIPGLIADRYFSYSIYFISVLIQFLVFALYRGYLNMIVANILQLFGTAIIPIAVFASTNDLDIALLWSGIITLSIMVSFLLIKIDIHISVIKVWDSTRKLIKYGVVRIPGFIAQFILLAGLPLLIAGKITKSELAFVNVGISLVRLSLIGVMPLGFVLLPRIANQLEKDRYTIIAKNISLLIKTFIFFGCLVTIFIFLNSEMVINIWLGVKSLFGSTILKYIILAFPFFTLTSILRTPIDAGSTKGYNSWVYSIGAISFLTTYYLISLVKISVVTAGVSAFIVGQIVTAVISLYIIKKLYIIRLSECLNIIVDVCVIGALMFLANYFLSIYTQSQEIVFTCFSLTFFLGALYYYYGYKPKWLNDVKILFHRKKVRIKGS